MSKRQSYCANCDEVQPYTIEPAIREWTCKVCGCPIECVECGFTMDDDHDCAEMAARMA